MYIGRPLLARYKSVFQMHAFYANHILLSTIWFKSSLSNHTIACIIWLFDNGSRTWAACIRDYHVMFLMNTSSNLIWELLNSRFGWTCKLLAYSVSRSFFCLLICNWWMHLQWKGWLPLTVCKREGCQIRVKDRNRIPWRNIHFQ